MKGLYLQYIKTSYNSITRKQTEVKLDKIFEYFTKEEKQP